MTNFTVKPKFAQIYKETYKPLKSWVDGSCLPASVPHLNPGLKAEHIEIRAAGTCLLNGKRFEFQDLRVYVDTSYASESE